MSLLRPDRHDFERWLKTNQPQPDFLDALPQHPRSIRDWITDLNRITTQAAANLGKDRGFAGIFGDRDREAEGANLRDPEGDLEDDEEEERF